MNLNFVGVSKSGVPDFERENFLGSDFQDVGAKTFKVLSSPEHNMQMKHFASCVGVNNIDCEPQEKEREVAPFSCASRGNVDMLGTSRLLVGGGVLRCSHVNDVSQSITSLKRPSNVSLQMHTLAQDICLCYYC